MAAAKLGPRPRPVLLDIQLARASATPQTRNQESHRATCQVSTLRSTGPPVHRTIGADDVGAHEGADDDEQAAVHAEQQRARTAGQQQQAEEPDHGSRERQREEADDDLGAHDKHPDDKREGSSASGKLIRVATHSV